MSVYLGFTVAEIRELVHEYELVRYGQKGSWLVGRGIPTDRMKRWRAAVFVGDLERALIPREGSGMTIPPAKRSAFERARAAEREAHDAERARLQSRVHELERTNDALGKAIGLLHAMNDQEPAGTPMIADPSDS